MKRSLFLILLLACLFWQTGCRCTPDRPYENYRPPKSPIVPFEKSVDFDLTEAKVTKEECVTVYDFDFCIGTYPAYGLAAEYKGQLVMLLVTEGTITDLEWSEGVDACQESSNPDGMNIDATGERHWYTLPLQAASQGHFRVTYEE